MTDIRLPGLEPHQTTALIPERPILVAYRGSIAHGMYVPPDEETGIDDRDIITVYIPPLSSYFGLRTSTRGKESKLGQWDAVAYEVQHFVDLLGSQNPNVLSLLWTKPEHFLHIDVEGRMLLDNRAAFASKGAYDSFGGYAYSQLKRMTNFKDEGDSACGCTGTFHSKTCEVAEAKGRGSSKRFATGFMGEKRKALVERFGYDTKNAAHLVRLLKMGIEFLHTGKMTVDRRDGTQDANLLLGIKTGAWPLEEVQILAAKLFEELREAKEGSPLPAIVDQGFASELLMDILCTAHKTSVVMRAHQVNVLRGGVGGGLGG